MVHFVNNSPIIANRNEIRAYVQANMQVDSITCSLTRTGIPPKNCELQLLITDTIVLFDNKHLL